MKALRNEEHYLKWRTLYVTAKRMISACIFYKKIFNNVCSTQIVKFIKRTSSRQKNCRRQEEYLASRPLLSQENVPRLKEMLWHRMHELIKLRCVIYRVLFLKKKLFNVWNRRYTTWRTMLLVTSASKWLRFYDGQGYLCTGRIFKAKVGRVLVWGQISKYIIFQLKLSW